MHTFSLALATQPAASAGSSGPTRPRHLESGGMDLALIDFQSYRNIRYEPPHAAACPYRFPTPVMGLVSGGLSLGFSAACQYRFPTPESRVPSLQNVFPVESVECVLYRMCSVLGCVPDGYAAYS